MTLAACFCWIPALIRLFSPLIYVSDLVNLKKLNAGQNSALAQHFETSANYSAKMRHA